MTLLEAMIERGLNRATLGAAMGVPAARVDAWITGVRRIHPVLFPRLAKLLGMSTRRFRAEVLPSLRSNEALDDQHRRGSRFSAHICFACPEWMRAAAIRCAREQGINTSELLRASVTATLATLNTNKGGADAGNGNAPVEEVHAGRLTPQHAYRSVLRRTAPQLRPASTVKSQRPRRPLLETPNPKKETDK